MTHHSPLGHVRGANRDAVLAVEPHPVGPCHLPSQLAQENHLGNGAQLPSGSRLRCCCRAVAVCDPSSEACCHRGGCVPNLPVAEEQRRWKNKGCCGTPIYLSWRIRLHGDTRGHDRTRGQGEGGDKVSTHVGHSATRSCAPGEWKCPDSRAGTLTLPGTACQWQPQADDGASRSGDVWC